MNQMLDKCPVCGNQLMITRLHCPNCETTLEGAFRASANPLARLTPEQVQFVLTFVRCEGRLNRMEVEMGMSYPTLRSRLMEIIRALGYEPGKDETPHLSVEERKRILEDLDAGRISPPEAQRLLRGKKDEGGEEAAGKD
jgi:hypothetical protein